MSNALAKIQQSGTASRPAEIVEVCLAQGVLKRIQALQAELDDLAITGFRDNPDEDAPSDQPSRKMGQGGSSARVEELRAEMEREYDVMRAATGKLTVEATISGGEWRQWADANPAREGGQDAVGRPILDTFDMAVSGGWCNATALIARLGDFATEWDGEPLAPGQWDWLASTAAPGDLKEAAKKVVGMYESEGAKALPKSSTGSSATPPSETS